MSNYRLLYILEDKMSSKITPGTFSGIDTEDESINIFMEKRFNKAEILKNKEFERIPIEYRDLIAKSQLDNTETYNLLNILRYKNMNMNEILDLTAEPDELDSKITAIAKELPNENIQIKRKNKFEVFFED